MGRTIIPVHLEPRVPLSGPLAGRTVRDVELHRNPDVAIRQLVDAMHGLANEKKKGAAWGWGIAGLIVGALLFGGGDDEPE